MGLWIGIRKIIEYIYLKKKKIIIQYQSHSTGANSSI